MKIFYSVTLLVILLISISTAIASDEIENKKIHNFGVVLEGDNPICTFLFTNRMKHKVKIVKIRAACGCVTSSSNEKKELAPGESLQFDIKLRSKGYRGHIAKAIYLLTDSDKLRTIKYTITAEIKPKPAPHCVAPSVVDAGVVPPNSTKKLTFELKNSGKLDLKVRKGSIPHNITLATKLPVVIPPGGKVSVKLTYTAPFYEGQTRTTLMLKTNDANNPKLWILIKAGKPVGAIHGDTVLLCSAGRTKNKRTN